MSVLIRGMEMPKSCDECPCFSQYDACDVTGSWKWADEFDKSKERLPDCPLVPVPPHGRLIDVDAIPYKKIMLDEDDGEFYYGVTQPYIDRMPTIIEAEEGE